MAASFLQRTLPAMWMPKRQRTERPRPSPPPSPLLDEDEQDCLLGLLLLSRALDHPDAVATPPTMPKQQSHPKLAPTEEHELSSPLPSPTLKQQQNEPFPPSTPSISDLPYECGGRGSSSYPALGCHNSSRLKRPAPAPSCDFAAASTDAATAGAVAKKPHECSVCRQTFPTGQALGGHMRSHSNGGRRRQATARNH